MYSINVTYTGATHAPARHFLLKERKKARLLAEAGGERWEQTDADFQWCGLQWWTPPTVTPTEFHSAHYPALFHEIRLRDGSTNPHRGNSDASLRWDLHKALFEDHSTTGSFSTTSSVEKCINALQRPCYRSSNCLWIVSKNDRRGWTKSQIHVLFDFAEHILRSCSHQSITAGPGRSWLTPWSWGWSLFIRTSLRWWMCWFAAWYGSGAKMSFCRGCLQSTGHIWKEPFYSTGLLFNLKFTLHIKGCLSKPILKKYPFKGYSTFWEIHLFTFF